MNNTSEVKIGTVAVSRGYLLESLFANRRKALMKAYRAKYDTSEVYECPVCVVKSETHMIQALEDIGKAGCNALCIYLDSFGPEISETLLIKHFDEPEMFVTVAEESGDNPCQGCGDAYRSILNASYNLVLHNVKAYIPEYLVRDAEDCADMVHEFMPITRAAAALNELKIVSFDPRPLDFLACNAPIKQLYGLGAEIEENSELNLFGAFNKHTGGERIPDIVKEMEKELGAGNKKPEILSKLVQYELTLKGWVQKHKDYRRCMATAGKCWPTFQTQSGSMPCYMSNRLTAQEIPMSCEVDTYEAPSEYIGTVISQGTVTPLDINNTAPKDVYKTNIKDKFSYVLEDTLMGSRYGNTASGKLTFCEMRHQIIMTRALPIEATRGAPEGDTEPGSITFYRLQSTVDNKLRAYITQGGVLSVIIRSFGSIGVFAIPEVGRSYRHVLTEKDYPHRGVVVFGSHGKALFEVFKYIDMDVEEIGCNQPRDVRYKAKDPLVQECREGKICFT